MSHRYFPLAVLAFALASTNTFAQIPNPSFETWTAGAPDGWYILTNDTVNVTQVSDAHEGNSAVRFQSYSSMQTGSATGSVYFACDCRPEALHYWYKLTPQTGNGFILSVTGQENETPSALGTVSHTDETAIYKEGVLNITYYVAGNMEEFVISLNSLAAELIFDDLSWGAATGIADQTIAHNALEHIYPNPASESVSIVYNLTAPAHVTLTVYDALGRMVAEAVNAKQIPGRYKAQPDVSHLAAGIYTAKLEANGVAISKSFAVSR